MNRKIGTSKNSRDPIKMRYVRDKSREKSNRKRKQETCTTQSTSGHVAGHKRIQKMPATNLEIFQVTP
jgi:hypothetical protein